jgi:hypothetical protein
MMKKRASFSRCSSVGRWSFSMLFCPSKRLLDHPPARPWIFQRTRRILRGFSTDPPA